MAYLDNMDQLEQSGNLVQDANEAKWIVDSLQRIVNRDAPQEVKSRAEALITAINQRLMSQYPLTAKVPMTEERIWEELEAAGYMRTPEHERVVQQEPEPEQKAEEEKPKVNDDDEMAETAGRLLERVADNTSEKFQNSQFLELMRRLRDREVRVSEDKFVDVADSTSTPAQATAPQTSTSYPYTQLQSNHTQPSSQIPGIDPKILDHASLDFDLPITSAGDDLEPQAQAQQYDYFSAFLRAQQNPVMTDEISDQFRSYNVEGAYHR